MTDSTEVMMLVLRAALIREAKAEEFPPNPVKLPVKPPVSRVGAAPVANLRYGLVITRSAIPTAVKAMLVRMILLPNCRRVELS
jgi:hypothetical protein